MAAHLQAQMFEEAAKIGGLEAQLVWYRDHNECSHSSWTTDTSELATKMSRIRCAAGNTKIASVIEHIRTEHQRHGNVAAAVSIGDACEEVPSALFDAAIGLGVPMFCFQ